MRIEIKLFANFKDRVGKNSIQIETEGPIKVQHLKALLVDQYPTLKPLMENSIVSINRNFAASEDTIPEGAEVAIFPPVSGGLHQQTIIRVANQPININRFNRRNHIFNDRGYMYFFRSCPGKNTAWSSTSNYGIGI